MKSIVLEAIITSIRSKVDRSIALNINTPELSKDEVALFFQLQGINVTLTITPEEQEGTHIIKREVQIKTPSQRLRAVLFVLWKQKQVVTSFEDWYESEMEQFIESVKEQLDD